MNYLEAKKNAMLNISSFAEPEFFVKPRGKYIDTGLLMNTMYSVDLEFSCNAIGNAFYGVRDSDPSIAGTYVFYTSSNMLRFNISKLTGTASALDSGVQMVTNKDYILSTIWKDDYIYTYLNNAELTTLRTKVSSNTCSTYNTLYFGARNIGTPDLSNSNFNVKRFTIYTDDTKTTKVYELVPKLKNGVAEPFETVSGTFATWLP